MKIFISGSMNVSIIPETVISLIDRAAAKYNDTVFLVGDCHGIDLSVQNYLASKGYAFDVYYSGSKVRNCSPAARNCFGVNAYGKYGREFYTQKDIRMTDECDVAIAVWDGKSAGTKANIDRAITSGKTVLIYRTDTEKLYKHTV